ncbi:MAG: GxxExxY protein [Myxococcota bacterium]
MREPGPELDALARSVIGAAIEVHRELGPGFLEAVYDNALAIEMECRGIPFERQPAVEVRYKGTPVGEGRLDFLVGDRLVVEVKAADRLHPVHRAQVLAYLKFTGAPLGLLLNFKAPTMREGIERIVRTS